MMPWIRPRPVNSRVLRAAGQATGLSLRPVAHRGLTTEKGQQFGKVFVLAGPTGVGKTDISVRLAQALNGEIISADSTQVYRGLDIATDKVTREAQKAVPHHLVDILDPGEPFSAGAFCRLARAATDDILSRGKLPIVVGGSSFYMQMYLRGTPGTPMSTPESRQTVQKLLDSDANYDVSVQRLATVDPALAAILSSSHRNDWYRLARALEIVLLSGKPPSHFGMKEGHDGYDTRCVFLSAPRLALYEHIEERCEVLVQRGLIQEFVGIQPRTPEVKQMLSRVIGYKEVSDYLDKEWLSNRTYTVQGRHKKLILFLERYMAATRAFAKQQWAWFRKEPAFFWMDATRDDLDDALVSYLKTSQEEKTSLLGEPNASKSEHFELTKEEMVNLRAYQPHFTIYHMSEAREQLLDDIEMALLEAGLLTEVPLEDAEQASRDALDRKRNRLPKQFRMPR